MNGSLSLRQVPEQRMQILTIEEILAIGHQRQEDKPQLEHYFSPSKKEKFVKDYIHFLNSCLLDVKQGKLEKDLYLLLVLNFQFVAPLLEIHSEKELGLFYRLLEQKYEIESPDINLHFTTEEFEENMVGEEEALETFRKELDEIYTGRRDLKESVQARLKQDGIHAIMDWQKTKKLPELAEAFGRSIVIPSFFSFYDRKLVEFYNRNTEGIRYEIEIPEFGEIDN